MGASAELTAQRRGVRQRRNHSALWASTSFETRGGVSSFVRCISATPLWAEWNITYVTTHRDGTAVAKFAQFMVSIPRFIYYIVRDRPAVVHLHVASYGSFLRKLTLSVIARALGAPVVTHVHGAEFDVFYANSSKAVQWAVRHMLGHSSAVIALGDTWAKRLIDIEPSAAVHVVPNPVRPAKAVDQPTRQQVVEVLFLGRVEDRKGTFCLIEAWHQMLVDGKGRRPARLTIVGDGEVDRANALVCELGLEDSVAVTGWASPAMVQDILGASHALVLPSHNEGQPMAILEAMANGLCIVASPVGGIPDLIDASCGVLVPPGDVRQLASALYDIVHDDQMRAQLGGAALERVRDEFDADLIWRKFDSLYCELA
jgi:glycosyltransferase involved in cell wall biosynthesis